MNVIVYIQFTNHTYFDIFNHLPLVTLFGNYVLSSQNHIIPPP